MGAQEEMKKILLDGLDKIGLDIGIISHIVGNKYVVYLSESTGERIPAGTEFDLEDTYCTDVVQAKSTKYYKDVAEISEMLKHPCYLNTQLRAYIGTPIFIDGEIWGTLNYSSLYPHKLEYTEEEIEYLESQAAAVGVLLATKE